MVCSPAADNTFGPAVRGCRNDFDFTLLFEQSVFQIAPSALLLLSVPLRVFQLRSQNVKTLRTSPRTIKQAAITALAGTQLALLVVWSITPTYRTETSIPAAVLSFLASLALLFLSSAEHTGTIQPSSLINLYTLFSLILDLPQARLAAKSVIMVLEAWSKRRFLFPPYNILTSETIVGVYDRIILWWLNPLFWKGYKSILSVDALDAIDEDLSSENVESQFQKAWAKRVTKSKSRRPLIWALVSSLRFSMLGVVTPRLCPSALKLSQPLLIGRVTAWLSPPSEGRSMAHGRGTVGATVCIYVGVAITRVLYKRQLDRLLTKISGTIIAAVHSRMIVLSTDKLADQSTLTLISADVNRVCASLQRADEFFASPFELAGAIALLQDQIGVSCVAPVAFAILVILFSFLNSNRAVPYQKRWLAAVQDRITYTAAVLGVPKGVKMLGLTSFLENRIQALRVKELGDYAEYRKIRHTSQHARCSSTGQYRTAGSIEGHCLTLLLLGKAFSPPLTLMMFTLVKGGAALTPTVGFTALSLVALLTGPIHELIHAVPMLMTALVSLDRVHDFLLLDGRRFSDTDHGPAGDVARRAVLLGDAVELSTLQCGPSPNSSDSAFMVLDSATVRLGKEKKLVLQDVSMRLAAKSLTVIIGPVGCGKPTLLKTIIGDIDIAGGRLHAAATANGVAHCAQDPWVQNQSVRSIVVGQSNFDSTSYDTVIVACTLTTDLALFPQGDNTSIGTKGVPLSGGQRQRIALARAMYARKDLVVDDTLSGLDANTSRHVYDNVFGPKGICKEHGMTVILATHSVQYLQSADQIVALSSDGTIAEQGSFSELHNRNGYVHQLNLRAEQEQGESRPEKQPTESGKPIITDPAVQVQQDLAQKTGDIAVYGYYAKSIGWTYGIAIVFTAITFGLGTTMPDLWVKFWTAADTGRRQGLGLWIPVYMAIAASGIISVFIHIWVMLVRTVPRSSAKLHEQLLHTAMRGTYSFLASTEAGTTLNRFSNDMSSIEIELAGFVMQTLDWMVLCVASAGLIVARSTYVGALVPFVVFVLYVLDLVTAAVATSLVATAVTVRGTSTAGSIGLSLLNILSFNQNLALLIQAWTSLETCLGAVARCKNFEETTPNENKPGEGYEPPDTWPASGALRMTDLTASYNDDGEDVLKGISLDAKVGEKVGICGRSGSGKSSLLLVLLRLLDNSSGSIVLDNVELSTVPRDVIRSRLTALPQEVVTVPGSLRDNIDPLGDASDSEVEAALRRVSLLAIVEERGGIGASVSDLALSQGQMQLFAVARALLHKSKLLIVDEMTAAVDSATEQLMMEINAEEFRESTVKAVAHRLETIITWDKLVVMDQGRIV